MLARIKILPLNGQVRRVKCNDLAKFTERNSILQKVVAVWKDA
jgi:hypothetical protein